MCQSASPEGQVGQASVRLFGGSGRLDACKCHMQCSWLQMSWALVANVLWCSCDGCLQLQWLADVSCSCLWLQMFADACGCECLQRRWLQVVADVSVAGRCKCLSLMRWWLANVSRSCLWLQKSYAVVRLLADVSCSCLWWQMCWLQMLSLGCKWLQMFLAGGCKCLRSDVMVACKCLVQLLVVANVLCR